MPIVFDDTIRIRAEIELKSLRLLNYQRQVAIHHCINPLPTLAPPNPT